MKTIKYDDGYSILIKEPLDEPYFLQTVCTAKLKRRKLARFFGIHAQQQCEAVITMHRAGATEESLELCAADIGRAALHEKSLKHHPMLLEV